MSFNSKYTGQEVEDKLDELQNITATDQEFRYKSNKVWHAGNDGKESGLDADTLDGYHRSNLYITKHSYLGASTSRKIGITVEGDYDTFYPVKVLVMAAENGIEYEFGICKSLSSLSNPNWEGNHSNGTSSLNAVYKFRCGGWDGNWNFIYTITAGQEFSQLLKHIELNNRSVTQYNCSIVIWLRGGNASYTLYSDAGISSTEVLYEKSLITDPDVYVEPKSLSDEGNNGIVFFNSQLLSKSEYLKGAEDNLAYWYENNENRSTTTCNRGGNRNVIESLRSKFKRCIAKPYGEDAALISFCNETNSNIWPDGSQITVDGGRKENRMTYFPKYYHKTVEMSPGVWRTYISEMQLDDDYIEEPEMLLSTFEAYNNNGVLYSGSGLTSTASQTMATFVTQAKANGPLWGIGDYRSHATIARMFCAYYGTTNISTANSAIPCSGGTKRYDNGKTGGTLSLGNVDGKTAVNGDAGYYSTNFLGLEDCYYSKWEFVQGVNVLSGKWVVYDGGSFPDKDVTDLEVAGATNIRIACNAVYNASTNGSGWTKKISHGRYGDIVPTELGGSDSTYYADYHWYNTGNRIVLRSGHSGDGSSCGVFVADANHASSNAWARICSRLAFYGKIVVVDSDDFKKTQI